MDNQQKTTGYYDIIKPLFEYLGFDTLSKVSKEITNNQQQVGYYDIMKTLFEYLDFDTLFKASQVCALWRRVGREILQQFLSEPNIQVTFRITKLRFLLPNSFTHNGIIHITLYQKPNKSKSFTLKSVRRDDQFTVYESTEVPDWCVTRFNWSVEVNLWSTAFYNNIGQIAPDDLCQQKFRIGRKYRGLSEHSVIGSGKLSKNRLLCCCPIQILSLNKIKFSLIDE